jgi:hypothetical protein
MIKKKIGGLSTFKNTLAFLTFGLVIIAFYGCVCIMGGGGTLDANGTRMTYPTPTPAPTWNPYDPFHVKGRFVQEDSGVIKDNRTGLRWYFSNQRTLSDREAIEWAVTLDVAGGRWRLPEISELKTLFLRGSGSKNIAEIFPLETTTVWTSDLTLDKRLYVFNFRTGEREELTIRVLGPERPGLVAVRDR